MCTLIYVYANTHICNKYISNLKLYIFTYMKFDVYLCKIRRKEITNVLQYFHYVGVTKMELCLNCPLMS